MICPLCKKSMTQDNVPAYYCPTCDVEADEDGLFHYVIPRAQTMAKTTHEDNLESLGYPSPEVYIGRDFRYTAVCEDTIVHFDGHRFFVSVDRGSWGVYDYLPNYKDLV